MTENVLQISDLRFRWPNSQRDLLAISSLSVNRGEKVFIKGASGSGKTTLLSLVGGVHVPTAGEIRLLGKDITRLSLSRRDHFRADHIGYIFQLFNLIPYLSVLDNIVLSCRFSTTRAEKALRQSGSLEEEALRLLDHLELGDRQFLRQPVVNLSVGQQQRVATARALMGSPEFIIADEPTSALDSDVREKFLALLIQECELADSTLLFVSHDSYLEPAFERSLSLQSLNEAVSA